MNRNNKNFALIAIVLGLNIFTAQANDDALSTENMSTPTSTKKSQNAEGSAEQKSAIERYQMFGKIGTCTPYPECKILYTHST